MTNLRATLTLTTLLLTSGGTYLTASQAQPAASTQSQGSSLPQSLFYERQTQVTMLGEQPTISTNSATATLSAIAQAQANSHTSDSSTSSATTASVGSTGSGTNISETEKTKIADEIEYKKVWAKPLGKNQQEIAQEIYETVLNFPADVVKLIAQYSYEFRGICTQDMREDRGWMAAIAIFPNGSLVSGDCDELRLWLPNKSNGQTSWESTEPRCACSFIRTIVILANNTFASGHDDGFIRIWSLIKPAKGKIYAMGTEQFVASEVPGSNFKPRKVSEIIVLQDGSLACGSSNGLINIWVPVTDTRNKTSWNYTQTLNTLSEITALVAFKDDSLVSGSTEGNIQIWLRATNAHGRIYWEPIQILNNGNSLTSMATYYNNSFISGDSAGNVKLWSPGTDAQGKTTWKSTQGFKASKGIASWGGPYPIEKIAVLWDGSLACGYSESIGIWSLVTDAQNKTSWKCPKTLTPVNKALLMISGYITAMAVLNDGSLASGTISGIMRVWR